MTRIACLTLLALGALAPGASAQVVIQGIRDLDFGVVLPGVQSTVAPTDPIRSGQFYFSTPALGTRVRVRFTLPNQLTSGGGATMPINFRNGDAMIQGTAPSSLPVFFNPNANRNFRMTTSRDANVWLGGTVSPAAGQAVGTYVAPVVLTVTIF
jgi:hypothetical protein